MHAARRRQADQFERDVILAWQTERIKVMTENAKRLPDLKTLLRRATQRQTPAEQLTVMQMISAQLNIPMVTRPRKGSPQKAKD